MSVARTKAAMSLESFGFQTLTSREIAEYQQREMDRNEAYSEGLDANLIGQYASANPHPKGSRKHEAWDDGWKDGQLIRADWEDLCDGDAA